jgi:hypothetical protein
MVDTQAKCQHVFTSAITYVVIESKVVVSIVISSSPRSDFVDLIGKSQDCVSKNRSHRRQTFRHRVGKERRYRFAGIRLRPSVRIDRGVDSESSRLVKHGLESGNSIAVGLFSRTFMVSGRLSEGSHIARAETVGVRPPSDPGNRYQGLQPFHVSPLAVPGFGDSRRFMW